MAKLLFFHSEDWAFCRHFLPMARAAQAAGFEVAVAVRVRNDADRLVAAGCRVIPLEAERRSFRDGRWVVLLADVAEPELVSLRVAEALGLQAADRPWRLWLPGRPEVSAYRRSPRAAAPGASD